MWKNTGTVRLAKDDKIRRSQDASDTHAGYTHTHTHTRARMRSYFILISFPRQQWLRECTSMLRYTDCIFRTVKKPPPQKIKQLNAPD
jgi:hypothetical protein